MRTSSARTRLVLPVFALLGTCMLVPAQGFTTTPPGEPQEGNSASTLFGAYANFRIQHLDGQHMGEAFTIHEVAYRMDYTTFNTSNGEGRTWSNVKLMLSENMKPNSFTNNFDANHQVTPTKVFEGTWTWPTLSGMPHLKPAQWGGPGGGLAFPYTTPFVYSGKGALVNDYTFERGTLANSTSWWGVAPYALDSEYRPNSATHSETLGIPPTRQNYYSPCGNVMVAAADLKSPSELYLGVDVVLNAGRRDSLMMQVVGLAGVKSGIDIGAACNKLHVDLTQPHVAFTHKWDAPQVKHFEWTVPWNQQQLGGLALYYQSSFITDQGGSFALTHGFMLELPKKFMFENKTLFALSSFSTPNGPSVTTEFRPFTRYLIK